MAEVKGMNATRRVHGNSQTTLEYIIFSSTTEQRANPMRKLDFKTLITLGYLNI